jgi:L-lactate dehydrogenase complex protein LldG
MSRSTILEAIRRAQPALKPLPEPSTLGVGGRMENSTAQFVATLDFIGARVIRGRRLEEAALWLRENLPAEARVASTVSGVPGNVDLRAVTDPHQLEGLNTAVFAARLGVCENGAVWVEEADLGHRVLPMIAEQLLIVVRAADLVADMHEAYRLIGRSGTGFGLFLAGPSKTADIEQCLVIGAHGARGATVFIWDEVL